MKLKYKIFVVAIIISAIAIVPTAFNNRCEVENDSVEKEIRNSVCTHQEVEWHRTIEPTCNTEGKAVAICLECNSMVQERSLETTPHPTTYTTVVQEGNGSEFVVEHTVCEVCSSAIEAK